MKSKYLYPWVRQSYFKRIIRWFYWKYVNEPFFPNGIIGFYIKEKGCFLNEPTNSVRINYHPNRYVAGMLEDYFFEGDDCKITIQRNEKN